MPQVPQFQGDGGTLCFGEPCQCDECPIQCFCQGQGQDEDFPKEAEEEAEEENCFLADELLLEMALQ